VELTVVDASVAVKWVVTEPDSAVATELLDRAAPLIAPSIIRVEVAGAAIRRYRMGTFDRDTAWETCQRWDQLVDDRYLQLLPVDELYDQAVELALTCKHAIPDCLYLAAAKAMNCALLTADRAFFERASEVHDQVRMLARAA
jgi:predicted nucleic acid-binding protein